MKKQLFFTALIVLAFMSVVAFKNSATNVPKKYASLTSFADGTMYVEYEDKKTEWLNKNPNGPKFTTVQEVNIISAKGYDLVSTHGGDKYHVYVFEKE
ncbi:MAG: hypothetical protein K1X81_06165 [Bacteroidia bacterium]|nr:hypothetical protein [Bacteroidia bacterium]